MVCSLLVLDIAWVPFCALQARDREISPLSVALTLTDLASGHVPVRHPALAVAR